MNWRWVLGILTFNVVIMASSYTMLIPFLPMYLMYELGVEADDVGFWSGVVFSASFAVSCIMAPVWGKLADTKGKRLMAIRSSFLLAVSYFFGGIVTSPEELVMMRLFQGFAAGLWPMSLAIMSLYAPPDKLGFCIGTMQGALTTGGIIGPLLGGVLAEAFGMRLSFFIGSGALLLNFLVYVFVIKEPVDPERGKKNAEDGDFKPFRVPIIRYLLVCAAVVQMVILILQPVLPLYVKELAGDLPNLIFISGLIFSLGGIAGAMAAPCWGWLGQRRGYFSCFLLAAVLAGSVMIIQGLPRDLYVFAGLQFVCGLFFSGMSPCINASLAEHTPASAKGRIFGLMFAAQQIGSIIGPLLGGVIASRMGMSCIFFLAGGLLIALSLFMRTQRPQEGNY